ncbi:uncharacterized protein LOC129739022 [Uranotaenia lowii]|uniref:uncharacterized protein LOC129739022 n=1 Tax=Uranotaenia lowii TaxID=190385 RepID=UPI002479D0AE|nr:uncharacterized protein LOC129739022 [Uranotaenia lowii]
MDTLRNRYSTDENASTSAADADACGEWDSFCRLCFDCSIDMLQIFPGNARPDRDLLWKVLECTTLKLNFEDDSSAQICKHCIDKMDDFCDYRMLCLRNDRQIKRKRQLQQQNTYSRSRKVEVIPIEQLPPTYEITPPSSIKRRKLSSHEQAVDMDDPLEDFLDAGEAEDELAEDHGRNESENEEELEPNSSFTIKREQCYVQGTRQGIEVEIEFQNSTRPGSAEAEERMSDEIDHQEAQQVREKKKRTRKILLYEEHAYQLLSSRPRCDSITWGCIFRKSRDCKATIGTKASGQILGNLIPQHNHLAEPFENKKPKAVLINAFRDVENIYLEEPYEIMKNRLGGDVLMYTGDRYSYSHSRKDGCRIWKCTTHRGCMVNIYLLPDGRIYKLENASHTDEKIQLRRSLPPDQQLSLSDLSGNIEERFPNPKGTFNYKIIKNMNKRNVLIYEGDRYTFYYRKTNGWIVWRCTVSKACQAMIYQLADESVVVLGETTHNHQKTIGD